MSDNKRPPGYVPLTIHELAAGHKGKRGTAFDYVFSLDARAVDDSVLSSSAARAATGAPRNGGRPYNDRQQDGGGRDQNRGGDSRGRRGSRRGRNNNNRRGYGGQDGDANFEGGNGNGNGNSSAEGGENFRPTEAMEAPAERVAAYDEE